MSGSKWQFWIDRGGTFTDVIGCAPDGQLRTAKLLSENPSHYEDAALAGIADLLNIPRDAHLPEDKIAEIRMGTTVATNALLERKGDRVLFLTTKGFRDALRIGNQTRPDIFAREIVLPEMLYEDVAEVSERLDAEGNILTALDETATQGALQKAYDQGIRSVAISFLHGYRNPVHEQTAAAIARKIGFTQISTGHETQAVMKYVPRSDTTVADAYLSPILRRYVDRISARTGNIPLYFMKSSGGLSAAQSFQGKDAILSGPAGGVVAAAQTATAADHPRMIGFDMGGTSTDVCHFDGAYERAYETEVAGVRLAAPMMNIHTVAAGGGSILTYQDGRLQVGPESAGADPGPACYGKDGPLTVTDANLIVGKINPDWFPHQFGPHADAPLDARAAREKFETLAKSLPNTPGVEELAHGFLTIATDNMARAIKKISIERGYDVSDYALVSFGGAGGQHACDVADALNIRKVLVHPLSGLLSAYGMGLAALTASRSQGVEALLADADLSDLLSDLEAEVKQQLLDQGADPAEIKLRRHYHLKYQGTDSSLLIPADQPDEIEALFGAAYQARFGFVETMRPLVIETVTVEAEATPGNSDQTKSESGDGDAKAFSDVSLYLDGQQQKGQAYQRNDLPPGATASGPALIIEDHATIVINPGWQAAMLDDGQLLMTRIEDLKRQDAIGTRVDPVMLEIFNNMFMSVAEEMGVTLEQTASSVNIKERRDFSCALFDANGALVANAPHVPVHLGSMGDAVRSVAKAHQKDMAGGDHFIINAPYDGGTHLPDITIVTPVFADDSAAAPDFFVAARGHHADIGGISPGSMPAGSTNIAEEGILFPPTRIVRDGDLDDTLLRRLLIDAPYPARNPDQNIADLKAQIAACNKGVRDIQVMVERYGLDVVSAYMGHVQANAEESVRRVIDHLKDGEASLTMDHGDVIKVKVTVDAETREAVIDFTGTSPQGDHNFNAPAPIAKAAVLYVFRTLVDRPIPLNDGCLAPLKLVLPEGSLINPKPPAAVVAGNVETSQMIVDCLYQALQALAGSQGTMNNLTFGNDRHQYYETLCGGTGAGPGFHGADGVHSHMTNSRLTDIEVLEWRYPVRLHQFGLRQGSGGTGQWRGGDGVVRQLEFLEEMTASLLSNHRLNGPNGFDGGSPGSPGRNQVMRKNKEPDLLSGSEEVLLDIGDQLIIETPGGGGWGGT